MRNGKYELVVAPEDYPGKRYRGKYCYEHRLVWWKHHGWIPSENQVIHHINGDGRDNRIENLECLTRECHTKKHNIAGGRETHVSLSCDFCGSVFEISRAAYRFKRKSGQEKFHCSRSCSVKNQWKRGRAG